MIFLDNASTTKINKESLNIYNEYSLNNYFNPSALYKEGADIKQSINKEKQNILKILNASKFDNLIFTSCATESNNMVIRSCVKPNKKALFSIAEHPSVYNVAKNLLDNGYKVEFIHITDKGIVDIDDFKKKLTDDVNFVSIMHVNNETGAINPISELVKIAKSRNKNIIFHSDGVQAFGKIDVNLEELGVDAYTLSSHKIYGPKGIGALYVKKGINIKPLLLGGGQEANLRSGTENTPAIFAFSKACELASKSHTLYKNKLKELNNYTKQKLSNLSFDLVINSFENYSPYIISFSLANLRAETILRMLEEYEILIGNGSACSSQKKGNRILSNMGLDDKYIEGSLRISFNYDNNIEEVDYFINCLIKVINEYKEKTSR